ncbi:RICIN domain-containing protein [Streptomyces sp. PSKA30]|uniref:RICIN domain-containing protein n=1 Tax=Streptomyces sp. PSKA30 TaxID=2874597 RepID=UPI001CD11F28|nr:RICIN domain-containing protein [Streptomyces sp. PSKA30]MBZ9645309.1 ricin-type beta-trefoil lectin domain protein [Streptomyces sp. PSKA30]
MKPPHTPRSPGDLPRRVPGSARSVGSGPAQDGDTAGAAEPAAPGSVGRTPDAAGRGASLPRLAQISSLGARGNADRGADAPGAATNKPGDDVARTGDKARREGFRGALGVVGIVGLLAVGGVLLTLGLVGGHDDDRRDGAPVAVDSGDYGTDVVDGLGDVPAPAVSASGTGTGKEPDGSAKPTSTSPKSSASSEDAPSDRRATAPAQEPTGTETTAPAAAPGVNLFSHASQRCIDIVGGKAVQGAKLMIWDCSESASQHWTFTGGTMRALGMCVQLAGGSTADGADLELATCNGSSAQRFVLNSSHDLVNTPANKCTDVRDNQTANGTRLQLWSCSGGVNQKWSTS